MLVKKMQKNQRKTQRKNNTLYPLGTHQVDFFIGCMKIVFPSIPPYPEKVLMKECGYKEIYDQRTRKTSYVRVFGQHFYPRFHCYVLQERGMFVIDLHLDQKAPLYAGQTAHSGEYDGDVVEREGERIRRIIEQRMAGTSHVVNKNTNNPPPMMFG